MTLPEVHLVGGSRAEALRLAPVAIAMREQGRLTPVLIAAGPDPDRVADVYAAFGLSPQITLPTGDDPAAAVLRFDSLWAGRTPAAVVLRDCMPGAMAAYWRRVPVVLVDAGRRSGELTPGVAESERRLLAQVTTVHLAATPMTAMNLLDEQVVAGDVLLTGSTVADAAQALAVRQPRTGQPPARRLIVLDVDPFRADAMGAAVRGLGVSYPDLQVVRLTDELSCLERADLLAEAYVVVTDDPDLPEEAHAFGAPVMMLGPATEHLELLDAGSALRVEPDPMSVVAELARLLEGRVRRDGLAAGANPYGDGLAAYRVGQAAAALLGHGQFPDPMPARPVAGVTR